MFVVIFYDHPPKKANIHLVLLTRLLQQSNLWLFFVIHAIFSPQTARILYINRTLASGGTEGVCVSLFSPEPLTEHSTHQAPDISAIFFKSLFFLTPPLGTFMK